MTKRVKLRPLTPEELTEIRRLASLPIEESRTALHALVILEMYENPEITADAAGQRVGFKSNVSGSIWLKRFHEKGVAGLQNISRGERTSWYSDELHRALITLALQRPNTLGYPNQYWTQQLLQKAFEERQGIKLGLQTITAWLDKAGYPWERQADWHDTAALAVPVPSKPRRQKTAGTVSRAFKRLYRGEKLSDLSKEEYQALLTYCQEQRVAHFQALTSEERDKLRDKWRKKYQDRKAKTKLQQKT